MDGRTLPQAVVLEEGHIGLGIARSLGRRGVRVSAVRAPPEIPLGSASRYVSRVFPPLVGSSTDKAEQLIDLARKHHLEGASLWPTNDDVLAMIAEHHDRLRTHFLLTSPARDVLNRGFDKRNLYAIADRLGLPFPKTHFPKSLNELERAEITFPAILKPAWHDSNQPFLNDKAWFVPDRAALLHQFEQAAAMVDPRLIMVQEWIPAHEEDEYAFGAVCVAGLPEASITVRRWRGYPLRFRLNTTYAESVDEPEIEAAATRILREIGHTGAVGVDFRRDARTGQYVLLDVNLRLWGWHAAAQAMGVDLPYLALQATEGKPIPKMRATVGQRWRRGAVDIPAATVGVLRGQISPVAYLRSLRPGSAPGTFARDDPLPALVEVTGRIGWRMEKILKTVSVRG